MDLRIDGNIAQTFGPESAAEYFARLLRVDVRSLRPIGSREWPHAFFITSPAVQDAPPSAHIDGRPAWLLDYAIRQIGTVVPQRIWSAQNPSDAQRYGNAQLNMPIFFVHNDRAHLGLPQPGAMAGDCAVLLGADAVAPVGDCSTTYIRINWPGYRDWHTQVMTRDQTPAHNTITLEKFVKRVASAVGRFFDEFQGVEGQFPNWRVGTGGITREQVILIGVIHISQGSWQPILQLDHYVMPRIT